MKTTLRRIATIVMAIAIVMTAMNPVTAEAAAKKHVKLNKKSVDLTIGGSTYKPVYPTVTLKVQNTKKAVKWSTSDKKVATVKKTGKYTAKVTAKDGGVAKITAKVDGKKYTCTVTVDVNQIYGEPALGLYMCNCGYAFIPVYESGLGRSAKLACGGTECTAEEWNAHMAEHRKNGESTDYKDTTKDPKPLGVRTCKCGYQMLGYVYGLSDEEYNTWEKHKEEAHRKYGHGPNDYNYGCVSYKCYMSYLYKY